MNTTDKAYGFIKNAIYSGRVPNACLITGAEGTGGVEVARRAAALLCTNTEDTDRLTNCPDYFEISLPAIKIEHVRALQEELPKRAFSNGWRVILLSDAHNMTEAAQNALLKVLEEPPKKTLFLLTGNESGLLQTIRSRCHIIRLGSMDWQQAAKLLVLEGADEYTARLCAMISDGNIGNARKLIKNPELMDLRNEAFELLKSALNNRSELVTAAKLGISDRESWLKVLEFMLSFCRDMLNMSIGSKTLKNIDKQQELTQMSARFTTGQINCIIEMLIETQERMSSNLSPSAAADRLFIRILEAAYR